MTCSGFYRDRRTGLTLAGKRIRKGCEVHRSGDYLNEVKMLQLCKSPYVVTLHGCSAQFGGPKGEAFNRVSSNFQMAGGQLEVCICSYADSIFNNKSEIRKSTSLLTPPCVSLSTF